MQKRCLTTVLVFLLFYFYEDIIFSSVFLASVYIHFTASSPEFSWKCSVFSTRILWLSNRVLRHKTLKQRWKGLRDRTDKQGHKDLEEWGERDGDGGPNFSTCYLKLFPNVTGSAHLASRGPVVSHVPALSSCAPIWGWWAISHMFNGSQHLFSVFPRVDMHFFWANKHTSDRGGWNSSPRINQFQCNNPAILEVWRESLDLNWVTFWSPLK